MKKAIVTMLVGWGLSTTVYTQSTPAPCGPSGDLSNELSTNVASDSRCFEIRMYTADTARDGGGDYDRAIDELHQRFREKEVAIFEKHGAEIVAVWQNLDNPNTLVWMLAYRDRAHRDEVWAGFAADPDWATLREKYDVSLSIETYWMSSTNYSNLR